MEMLTTGDSVIYITNLKIDVQNIDCFCFSLTYRSLQIKTNETIPIITSDREIHQKTSIYQINVISLKIVSCLTTDQNIY